MTRIWKEHLEVALIKTFGTKKGAALHAKYVNAFPTSYQEDTHLSLAIEDITQLEQLSTARPLEITFYQRKENNQPSLHLRLFQYGTSIPLSDVLPILENLDLRTFNEHPYEIRVEKNSDCWISDFSVGYATDIHDKLKKIIPLFQDAFTRTVFHLCENDGFNKLVLGAELTWREIMILRAYAKYLHQIRFRFSQSYIENTVTKHSNIAKDLITLFKLKFDPKQAITAKNALQKIEIKIQTALDAITSLDEDRIMRYFWKLICASLRTNYFQTLPNGQSKTYLSIKFQSNDIPDLPLPHPLYEIFVYSPRFEAIHLRAEKVARGGIRWSDRREDFRTEVLNLMKAQKVKNAIIVPSGAKGGFVLKTFPLPIDHKALEEEVIICYKEFISGLLDLTDNLKNNKVIRPKQVVCYDEPDTYLVVAADKGTATFSDIANSLSKKYDFWLGDAFASGGSTGYDHKKIGITARGAWESIRRHFHELNININKTDFTVVGIGDMSGDVFGNGMIYSRRINLIGAFDHRNIFIDPNPHPETSYRERVRLFKSPHLSWEDYNSKLISRGGGVFKRSSKSISISPEIKKCLEIEDNALTPNELIRALLKAPVDLLFNGGIGTYVKSSAENNSDIGDKGNEFCRINGNELRCRIVGEGGNLGFTQLGRVEYALGGGLINTDFIDNSGGVDCSDHEV
ncbi:MAG TPA: NAD-glutamate dehydrogenase domain-containing protein, partial [Gammaproteobacteria bacterium]|nr:NAD-glutamate dehydrogenase domain-containing protein [Gammaproteobacteria bacterium]